MILAAVDDLLFSSRIRAAARQVAVEVRFARSPEAVLEQVRVHLPVLLLVDLDCARVRPLETIAAVKADAVSASVCVVGFVSHVHADLVEAARAAGADRVMARSTFVANLPGLLAGTE